MTRFIHSADWHVGMENYSKIDPDTGLPSRLNDFLTSIDAMVDFAIKEKVDFFLFSGDAYKTREPTPTHQREFSKRVLRLAKADIPVVLLVGNHDTPNSFGKANSLDIYSALEVENVYVVRDISLIEIKSVQIVLLPWLSRKEFSQMDELLTKVLAGVNQSKPLVVAAHASVEGAIFGSERTVNLGSDFVVSKETLTKNSATVYVALGHIHKRQIIPGSIPIVYSGSIERVDFGEEHEEKSFELVTINKKDSGFKATHKPIPTKARGFLSIKVEITDSDPNPTDKILKSIQEQDVLDKVVKLILNFSQNANFEINLAQIRKALASAYIIAAISKNIDKSERKLLGVEIAEKLEPKELLEKYFQAKGYSQSKITNLGKLADELFVEDV